MEEKNIYNCSDISDVGNWLFKSEGNVYQEAIFECKRYVDREGNLHVGLNTQTCKHFDMENPDFGFVNLEIFKEGEERRKGHKDTLILHNDGNCLVKIEKGDILRIYFWLNHQSMENNKGISSLRGVFHEIFFQIEKIFEVEEKYYFSIRKTNREGKKDLNQTGILSYGEALRKKELPIFDKDMPTDHVFLKDDQFRFARPEIDSILNKEKLNRINGNSKKFPVDMKKVFYSDEESVGWQEILSVVDEIYGKSVENYQKFSIKMDTLCKLSYFPVTDRKERKRIRLTFSTGFYRKEMYFYPTSVINGKKIGYQRYSFDDNYNLFDFLDLFGNWRAAEKSRYPIKLDLISVIPAIKN